MKDENLEDPVTSAEMFNMIRTLEDIVRKNPDDPMPYYHLGHLYECVARDDACAKRNYLNYLIRSLGYRHADEAIGALKRDIAEGREHHIAHINLGQIYCYQNRFDEAETELRKGTRWTAFDTVNFRLHVIPGSHAHQDIEVIKYGRERALARIQDLFEVAYTRKERIFYYFYESRVHKALMTGDQMPGHVFADRGEVHAVYSAARRVDTPHEDAHIVLRELGHPPRLIEEGAALYADRNTREERYPIRAGTPVKPGTLSSLLDDKAFEKEDAFMTYQLAYDFADFLVSRYGMHKFKRLYGSAAERPTHAFGQVYAKTLEELEKEFLNSVHELLPEEAEADHE